MNIAHINDRKISETLKSTMLELQFTSNSCNRLTYTQHAAASSQMAAKQSFESFA